MKHILVPTDFSKCSINALHFALEVARKSNAKVVVLHAKVDSLAEPREDELERIVTSLGFGDLDYKLRIEDLNLIDAIFYCQICMPIDLIVMGTNGASELKRITIGTNTIDVIREVQCPIIIVPDSATFESLKVEGSKVILASDFDVPDDDFVVPFINGITRLFKKADLVVLGVRKKGTKLDNDQKLIRSWLLNQGGDGISHTKATVFSNDVLNGIDFYIRKHNDVGLLIMLADQRHRGLFKKSYTENMAAHTSLPLLVLHK